MTIREFYLQRREAEMPAFMKVLKALPKDQVGYKPHEKSPDVEQLVWTLTSELKACIDIIADSRLDWKHVPPPPLEEMIEKFEGWANELRDKVAGMTDEAWDKKAQLFFDGKLIMESPTGEFLWFLLFDAIHHRGQLSAYLRPMGGKVPSIYGPSADEQGGV